MITLHGRADEGSAWQVGFEYRYSGPEQIHVKPVAADLPHLDRARKEVSVICVPPFSGIGVNETRLDRPYQDMLIGQGKAGDILRNLLLEVAESDGGRDWQRLQNCGGYLRLPLAQAAVCRRTLHNMSVSKGAARGRRLRRAASVGCFNDGERVSSGAAHPCVHVCAAFQLDPAG